MFYRMKRIRDDSSLLRADLLKSQRKLQADRGLAEVQGPREKKIILLHSYSKGERQSQSHISK